MTKLRVPCEDGRWKVYLSTVDILSASKRRFFVNLPLTECANSLRKIRTVEAPTVSNLSQKSPRVLPVNSALWRDRPIASGQITICLIQIQVFDQQPFLTVGMVAEQRAIGPNDR